MHGEQPGDAHVEGLLGTRQQVRLRPLQDSLRLPERHLGVGIQFDLDVVGPVGCIPNTKYISWSVGWRKLEAPSSCCLVGRACRMGTAHGENVYAGGRRRVEGR